MGNSTGFSPFRDKGGEKEISLCTYCINKCKGDVITQHYRFLEIAFRKSVYDSKKNLMHRTHLSFDSSVVSETAPSSRSVTT